MATKSLPPFLRLPAEAHYNIFEYLARGDLASLRLVSKLNTEIAASVMFASLGLTNSQNSCSHLLAVMRSQRLSSYVRMLTIPKMDIDAMKLWFGASDPSKLITDKQQRCLGQLSKLCNLSTFIVGFNVAGWSEANGNLSRLEKFAGAQANVFDQVFQSLIERTPGPLQTLCITNPPAPAQSAVMTRPNFATMLGKIRSLGFCIVTSDDDHEPYQYPCESNISMITDFFTSLPQIWLTPVATNLSSLTLNVHGQYWGYYPRCDFRHVRLPRLQHLALRSYTFSHDWQLRWLAGLDSLRSLRLVNCAILIYAALADEVDHEGYPVGKIGDYNSLYYSFEFRTRWSTYWDTLALALPNLEMFDFDFRSEGNGDWLRSPGGPNIQHMDLLCHPYVIFDYSEWRTVESFATSESGEESLYNHALRDSAALRKLQRTVAERSTAGP